ncbi:hypothetical protein HJC23_004600 [Cyclotella cryptica]|uniref:Phosducin domain-containing protein n=1 Tax=Cyclotella cryptica TaxID=29204 RepID=A0ABD3QFE5_9STRA|eukprot:CCRYP_005915-RA/>CCRYP_005915-RA protein AED:0.02 eAED:0.02 QI:153/-1/1/1/-1/1/1/382/293
MDLEDAFLKQNVPGRYRTWSRDPCDTQDDQDDSDNDSQSDEYYFQDAPSLPLSTDIAAPSTSALKSKAGNTGVKGVIGDYFDVLREEQLRSATDRLERLEILRGMTRPRRREDVVAVEHERSNSSHYSQDDDRSNGSEEDDEFLQSYRSKRMQQLVEKSAAPPTYGTYMTITPDEYVSLVDTIDPQTLVVVHLYESSIKESSMLHSALEKVAQVMEHVKFIAVNAYEAKPDLDGICLPVVLVYRGGELLYSSVRFTDGLVEQKGGGDCLDVEDVKEALENLGVVDPTRKDARV